jgi:lipopolysaccharide export system permease protein
LKILDRYLISFFTTKLLWAVLAAIVIFVVMDLAENLDDFIDNNAPASIIFRYYYLFVPYIFYLVLPVAALLATLFTIGGMTVSNELTAIKVAGVPFLRPLFMLTLATCGWAFFAYVLGETLIPSANHERMNIMRYEVKKVPRESGALKGRIYVQMESDRQLYIDHYRAETKEAFGVRLLTVENGKVINRIDAAKMIWLNDNWILQDANEMAFKGMDSVGCPVLWEQSIKLKISGDYLRPDELEKVQTKPEEMNASQLQEFLSRFRRIGGESRRWEVELYAKAAHPVAAIIIVVFGAPIAAVRRRGGTALGFGLSLFICFLYFGLIQTGKIFGIKGVLDPWFSAWIGNIVFAVLGVGLLFKKTE